MTVPTERLDLMRQGEAYFLGRLEQITDGDLFAPSGLPGWTRAHVVSHFARNALALINLLDWARTGEPTPMYPSVEARAEGIEEGARQSASVLRSEAVGASEALRAAASAMPEDAWDGEIRTALGRQTTGSEVPWMRIRESWVHAVDLDAGAAVGDFPPKVVADLLDEVTGFVTARDGCPPVVLDPSDTEGQWRIGPEGDATTLTGTQSALLGWLIGRGRGERIDSATGAVPDAPRWL